MKGFFERIRKAIASFMVGRYGSDQLNRFLMAMAFVSLLLFLIFPSVFVFRVLIWVFLALCYFRMFSRNIQKRYNENTRYLQIKERVQLFFTDRFGHGQSSASSGSSRSGYGSGSSGSSYGANTGSRPRSDAEHRIFRCPKCDQRVRVPRGRGKISITCPKCGHEFIKRS